MFVKSTALLRLRLKKGMVTLSWRNMSMFKGTIRTLDTGIGFLPHIDKRHKGGEDAYWTSDTMIAVADGVGGWADSGVDPALYSRRLWLNIKEKYLKDREKGIDAVHTTLNDPKELLTRAVEDTRERGSSTAVIWMLDTQKNYLHTANLGDSGYLLLRKSGYDLVTLFRSKEQTHGFNFPYQVGSGGGNYFR